MTRGGITSPDTLISEHKEEVQITHPTHPLRGQRFEVVPKEGRVQNDSRILIQFKDGKRQHIPVEWTDQVDPPPSLPEARFLVSDLMVLRRLLDEYLKSIDFASNMPLKDQEFDQGGRHANPNLDADQSQTANADHSSAGADPVGLSDAARQGKSR